MEKEGKGKGMKRRGRRGGVDKMRGIIMALFLGISFLLISCGNRGPVPKELREGQAATADGTLIDLKVVSQKIKDVVAFSESVKEVETLVKSIDELAKGIGKKIQSSGLQNDNDNLNGTLLAGAYQIMSDAESKLTVLEGKAEKFAGMKDKVTSVKQKSTAFLNKLKLENATLGAPSAAVSSANAKEAIDRNNGAKSKVATELVDLNTEVDTLLIAVKSCLANVIKELTVSSKESVTDES